MRFAMVAEEEKASHIFTWCSLPIPCTDLVIGDGFEKLAFLLPTFRHGTTIANLAKHNFKALIGELRNCVLGQLGAHTYEVFGQLIALLFLKMWPTSNARDVVRVTNLLAS